ncbi:hypothetical protein AEP_03661 [Curvibacter sp. AEP1-3]|uniref:hypothetical protein n=1 Tax=Curvibacter sp. AEP1-3 TaxID=1844971 RepID=UPI000B5842CD|nr:hypothetical protein [Curvibacter sp. AEP1-3]ARV20579.1 hypothetical protein AEP_03661 [Curvibacter sp. AEP1-3]
MGDQQRLTMGNSDHKEESRVHTPSKKKRASNAQQVVENAKRRNAEQGNVENLPCTRLEHGTDDGNTTLTAIFPRKGGGEPQRLDLSFMLEFPGLSDFFADGLLKGIKNISARSRVEIVKNLRCSWFAYLRERGYAKLSPEDLDEQILTGYSIWLNECRKEDGKAIHPATVSQRIGALRILIRGSNNKHLLDLIPSGPRGIGRKKTPTKVLQFDQLIAVVAAVEKEVIALQDNWKKGQSLLMEGRQLLRNGAVLGRDLSGKTVKRNSEFNIALALAMIDERYPGVIPNRDEISAHDKQLGWAIHEFGSVKMSSFFYASGRDLVPLVLSIAIATVFNPETVLKLNWKDIDRNVDPLSNGRRAVQFDVTEEDDKVEEPMDTNASSAAVSPLVKITGDKPRANRKLVRLLDPEDGGANQVSLNMVLNLIKVLTERIRPFVIYPERYADRIFLFVPKIRAKRAKSFGGKADDWSPDIVWTSGLAKFIKDNNLPDFTLKTIRATMLDYVQLFNHGDLEAARKVGNHLNRITTWTHYTSDLVKRMLQEATGETILVRERWLDSEGKIDPRKHRELGGKGCATPGWICLDPFDSPRPNQRKGRLCRAYGECPDCPLAAARPDNPRNVMLYEALRRAIYRSIARVTPPVWDERWAPVVVALDNLLVSVPAQVLQESRKLTVELPDIG